MFKAIKQELARIEDAAKKEDYANLRFDFNEESIMANSELSGLQKEFLELNRVLAKLMSIQGKIKEAGLRIQSDYSIAQRSPETSKPYYLGYVKKSRDAMIAQVEAAIRALDELEQEIRKVIGTGK